MIRTPGQIDQLFLDWGVTGLEASIGVRVLDDSGATTISRTTGFTEYPPGSGLYYLAPFTFPTVKGSYTLLYDIDAGVAAPGNTATEELEITSTIGAPFVGDTYATIEELFRVLRIREPNASDAAYLAAATRVLAVATGEINAEIDREDDDPVAGWEVSVCESVCLDRAADLWRHTESVPGVLAGLEDAAVPARQGFVRYSWERYAQRLAPLKRQWGFA